MSYNNRKNFATSSDIPNYPDFLDIQVKSFKDFFQLETKSDENSIHEPLKGITLAE